MALIYIIQQKASEKESSLPISKKSADESKWQMNDVKVENMAALGAIESVPLSWDTKLTKSRFLEYSLHVGRTEAMAHSSLHF